MVVPTNGLFIVETPIKTDDLGVPPFQETSISLQLHLSSLNLNLMYLAGGISLGTQLDIIIPRR
jgi:hypothetical protein